MLYDKADRQIGDAAQDRILAIGKFAGEGEDCCQGNQLAREHHNPAGNNPVDRRSGHQGKPREQTHVQGLQRHRQLASLKLFDLGIEPEFVPINGPEQHQPEL